MNTPVQEIPYRDTLVCEDGKEFACIVLAKTQNEMRLQIDDERAGDEDGKIITLSIIQ
jgi:hypothetical protein